VPSELAPGLDVARGPPRSLEGHVKSTRPIAVGDQVVLVDEHGQRRFDEQRRLMRGEVRRVTYFGQLTVQLVGSGRIVLVTRVMARRCPTLVACRPEGRKELGVA
jgi:hypothetical protein